MYLGVSVKINAYSAGYFAVSYRFLLPNKKKLYFSARLRSKNFTFHSCLTDSDAMLP